MFRRVFSLAVVGSSLLVALAVITGRALPRGEQFPYSTSRSWSSGPWSISLVDVARHLELRVVDRPADSHPGSPVLWSPDGARIVFATQVDEDTVETWMLDIDQGRTARRLGDEFSGLEYGAAWSPDGSRLAYIGQPEDLRQLYVAEANGTAVRQLTQGDPGFKSAAWSPDSTWLILETDSSDEDLGLLDMRAGGAPVMQEMPGHPVWSPDGDWIAFLSNRATLESDPVYFDLFIMRPRWERATPIDHQSPCPF
jgi:Tol biopolymer transport system component